MLADSNFLFSLLDTNNCAINKFTLYDGDEKIEGNQTKAIKLDATDYLEDGVVSINSDFNPVGTEVQQLFEFTLRAEAYFNKVGDSLIKVIIGCFDETQIRASRIVASASSAVKDFTDDGAMFKIYLEKRNPDDTSSNTATFLLEELISWTTDISMCYAS